MKKILVGLLLSCAGLSVSAQTSFSGFSVFGNLNHLTSSVKYTDGADTIDGLGKSSVGFTLGTDYGFSLGKDSVLLLGATFNFGSPELFDFNVGGDNFKFEEKTAWSLYLAPGVEVVKDVLLYGKLAYHDMKVKASGDITGNQSFNGVGYGIGSRVNLNKTTFMTVEFQQINFGKETTAVGTWEPKATVGSVGIGFKF